MPTTQPPKLLDRVRIACRRRGYSYRTEQAYVSWTRRYVRFHNTTHPRVLGTGDVRTYLNHLAVDRGVAASTQNQALNALVFLYDKVLDAPIGDLGTITPAKRPRRLPTVLSRSEVRAVLNAMKAGANQLVADLLYGSGLRLSEALRLRVKDVDRQQRRIVVRDGKGRKDRVTMLPHSLLDSLNRQLRRARLVHEQDLADDAGGVSMPDALARKYPHAARTWIWQFVFPSARRSVDPRSAADVPPLLRHHRSDSAVQRAVKAAVDASGIEKRASCHTLRHSFATHLIEDGYDVRTVQELLGHTSLRTTMKYVHVLNQGPTAVHSPLDTLSSDPSAS